MNILLRAKILDRYFKFNGLWKNLFFHKGRHYCPVCGKHSHFNSVMSSDGRRVRKAIKCPYCGSLERHRLLWIFLQKKTDIFKKATYARKILHVAPERCFEKTFLKLPIKSYKYLTADLYNPRAMIKMDITNIKYPAASFDAVICNHVLEHVVDDRKALKEFQRILKKGGWAILLVPITDRKKTLEDSSITDPKERLKIFGQEDHVRCYGTDYVDRLRAAGFKVSVIRAADILSKKEIINIVAPEDENIYYCVRK